MALPAVSCLPLVLLLLAAVLPAAPANRKTAVCHDLLLAASPEAVENHDVR
jgi:hypothetical protein